MQKFVYGLFDKGDPSHVIRYVGATVDIKKRMRMHHYYAGQAGKGFGVSQKNEWVAQVIKGGGLGCVVLSGPDPVENWEDVEREMIQQHSGNLLNVLSGGMGRNDADRKVFAESARKQMSDPDEVKRRMASRAWYRMSDETRQKLREASTGRIPSAETRRKCREAMTGFKHAPESKEAISRTRKERIAAGLIKMPTGGCAASAKVVGGSIWITDGQANARHNPEQDIPSGWWRGRTMSEASKAKMAASMRGKAHTEDHKKMMSEKMTAIRASKKW